jgi:hypothetical protein
MNNHLIKTVLLAALINARAAVAQTAPPLMPQVTSQFTSVGSAVRVDPLDPRLSTPIGHRQPRTKDVAVGEAGKPDPIEAESVAVDRKLTICRGC